MENYGKIEPTTGIHTRLIDFQKALHQCIDYALDKDVDLFLFSGDAYKTANPTPTHQRLLMECFLRLFKRQIPIVMIICNHDHPMTFGKAHALEIFGQLPLDGFHVIAQPKNMVLQTKSGPLQITGIPWPTRGNVTLNAQHASRTGSEITELISNALAQIIADLSAQLDPQIPSVLAGHLTVSSGVFSGSEKKAVYGTDPLLLPTQLAVPPYDYVALGHLHRYQNLNKHGHPAIVYSGSIERIDFGERKEEKGFCYVEIPEPGTCTHEFVPVVTRPFIQIDVQLDDDSSHTEQILAALKQHTLQDAIVKIVYTLPAHIKDRVDLAVIHHACAAVHYLVGIFPVRPVTIKETRTPLKIEMGLQELLARYFSSKIEYKEMQDELIKKTLELADEASQEPE